MARRSDAIHRRPECDAPLVSAETSPTVADFRPRPMPTQLAALAAVLRENKSTLVARWQATVCELPGAAHLDGPTLRDHIPQFIDELIAAIARHDEEVAAGRPGSPVEHGLQRLAAGFDIKEVVIEYTILRDAVHDVAETNGLRLRADDCRVINHIVDDAIAWAVDTFAREQAAERQRRREEYFAFVAHDIRTPLNAISLTADLLAEDSLAEAPDAADMLRAMHRNVRRIEDLIRRVMEEEHHPEAEEGFRPVRREIDLWPLVHRLLQDVRPVTEAARIRTANAVPRHLTVDADAGLLARALQNLVGNAVKFAPGGEIEIGARGMPDGVECWVRDNGAGIAPERIAVIFDKRETDPDPTRAGSGFGLAILKQIVEAHGGAVSVESQPGSGSTFRFTIPAQASQQPAIRCAS